jgi:hypothetical protein
VLSAVRIYFQGDPTRAAVCPLTIHALLHIADCIKAVGPVWASWAFPTERYCGYLTPAIKSRRHPWTNIDSHVVNMAHLQNVTIKFNIESELSLKPKPIDRGHYIEGCKLICVKTRLSY